MRIMAQISLYIALTAFTASPLFADQLIANGTFEAGTLAGWTTTNAGSGSWYDAMGTTSPISGRPTAGPASGTYYALTDQSGPGAHALAQTFTLTGGNALLSFDMFVNNFDGGTFCGNGLSYTSGVEECGRADILSAGATAFDTGSGVVENLFQGSDTPIDISHPYTPYTFNLSGLVPGTYQLRFAEADNQGTFNMGVDNVSLTTLAATPEPSSFLLLGTGLLSCVGIGLRRFGTGM